MSTLAVMPRRQFIGYMTKGAAAVVIVGTVGLEGCSLAQDIQNWVPVGIASMKSIEAVLTANGFPLSGTLLAYFNDVIVALNAVDAAAMEYSATTPPPVTAVQKLQAAIKAVTDQLATFLSALSLPGGGIVSLIVGLAQIIISTIMAFANRIPTPATGTRVATISSSYKVGATTFSVLPISRSRRAFKHDFNRDLDNGKTAGVMVPASAYL